MDNRNEIQTIIQLRNDSSTNWSTEAGKKTPLVPGEVAVEITDSGKAKLKIGTKEGDTFESAAYFGGDTAKVFQSDVLAVNDTRSDVDVINTLVNGAELNEGDCAIVKRYISDPATTGSGAISYTSYVYDNGNWAAMDGNYTADNVFFKNDITLAGSYTTVGNVKKDSNAAVGTLAAAGKSLSDIMQSIFTQEVEPTVTAPSVSLSASAPNSTAAKEIGSYITTLNWDGTSSNGSYTVSGGANQGTGLTANSFTWNVSNDINDSTSNAIDGSFTLGESKIQIDSTSEKTYATITAEVDLDISTVTNPKTNLNNERPSAKITGFADGSVSKTLSAKVKLTGYRNTWYYVGEDCESELNSAFIRSTSPKNANTKSIGTLNIPKGTKRVMVAIPGSATLTEVIDIIGQNLDVKGNFTKDTIAVEGANGYTATNYTVFHFENPNGIAETKYKFTIN